MNLDQNAAAFIVGTFRTVWSLELLLQLRRYPDRSFSTEELVTDLRASDAIISAGLASLVAAGLVSEDRKGLVRYAPAARNLDEKVAQAQELYRIKPDAVRRLIVRGPAGNLAAFADAFKLWGK